MNKPLGHAARRSISAASVASRAKILRTLTIGVLIVAATGCGSSRTSVDTTILSAPVESAAPDSAASVAVAPIEQPVEDMDATLLAFLEDPRMEAAANGTFHTFVALTQRAGLNSIFDGPGPMALFPPTDEAFARTFTPDQLAALSNYQVDLAQLLNFHAANGIWPLSKVIGGIIPTMQINELHGKQTDGVLRINDAVVRAQAVRVSNGYIYALNDVLMPPGFQLPAAS